MGIRAFRRSSRTPIRRFATQLTQTSFRHISDTSTKFSFLRTEQHLTVLVRHFGQRPNFPLLEEMLRRAMFPEASLRPSDPFDTPIIVDSSVVSLLPQRSRAANRV